MVGALTAFASRLLRSAFDGRLRPWSPSWLWPEKATTWVFAGEAAVVALGRIGDPNSVLSLAECLSTQALAEHAALALLTMGDARGLHFHREALTQGRTDLSGHPAEIVGRYGGPENLLLLKIVAQQQDDVGRGRCSASRVFSATRVVQEPYWRRCGHAMLRSSRQAARSPYHGTRTGPRCPERAADVEQWWHENGATLQPGIRYR